MNWSDYKVLIVDDEKDIIEFLTYNLAQVGFQTFSCSDGKSALKLVREIQPHLVLLDVMMPEMDGIETCEEIRKMPDMERTLIAFLTARGEDYSQIAGFEAGGDDYITKPIKPKLLISKIKSLLKRVHLHAGDDGEDSSRRIVSGDLIIDQERYIVINKGKDIFFPRKEFELLSLLISKPDKVFTRDEIFQNIWGDNIVVGDRTIDVHIRKLREKLGNDHIKTVKGIGYKYSRLAE